MKGHMEDGKFHPHTDYKKGIRKSRDQQEKTEGVKIRKKRSNQELKEFKLVVLQNIWHDLDFAQRGGALEQIFPPTKKQEMEVRWSLRPQFKNAHTDKVSKLPQNVQNGLMNFYKVRIDEAVENTEMKPMGSFEDAFTKAVAQSQNRKARDSKTRRTNKFGTFIWNPKSLRVSQVVKIKDLSGRHGNEIGTSRVAITEAETEKDFKESADHPIVVDGRTFGLIKKGQILNKHFKVVAV